MATYVFTDFGSASIVGGTCGYMAPWIRGSSIGGHADAFCLKWQREEWPPDARVGQHLKDLIEGLPTVLVPRVSQSTPGCVVWILGRHYLVNV